MIVTHKFSPMDLASRGVTQRIDVVQDDKYSRNLEFTLTQNGEAWSIPEGAAAVIRFQKSDGTGGNYDTLPDGSSAYSFSGNVLTVALAPQVCTVPGLVLLAVGLMLGDSEINTFTVHVIVQQNPGIDAVSEDYTNMRSYIKSFGWPANVYLCADENGNVSTRPDDIGTALTIRVNDLEDEMAAMPQNYAPAGYGLGGVTKRVITSVAGLDDVTAGGSYFFSCPGSQLVNVALNYATVTVYPTNASTTCFQELRPIQTNTVFRRYLHSGTWSEWEVENPPMSLGVEYRTTERWGGKVVYTKLVNIGAFANGATVTVTNAGNYNGAIRVAATVGGYLLPFFLNGKLTACVNVEPTTGGHKISCYSDGTLNGITTYVQLWYVKS
ncbi:MAG: pyocin knob domain-containing protein [Faecousia sp.]